MEIVNQFIELCCYVCALYFLTGVKLTKDIWKYGISFFIIAIVGIWFEKSGSENAVPIWILIQIICLYSFISASKIKKILFSIGTVVIIGFFDALVTMGLSMLNINIVELNYSMCICLVILLIISMWVKIFKKNLEYPKISIYNYVLVMLIAGSITGLIACEITYPQSVGKRGEAVTTIIVISIVILVMIMIIALIISEISLRNYKERNILMEKHLEMQEKYYMSVCDNYDNLRRFEHDIKKHFDHISVMMEDKKYEETKDYVDQLSDQPYSVTSKLYSCSNYTISAILNQLSIRIEAESIQFDFDYKVFNAITVKAVDLSIVLYNLLHNAIEACEKVEREKRKIFLGFYGCENTLVIKINNSVAQKVNEQKIKKFQTSKRDSEKHGFGLMNVNTIVKKYNGQIEYKCEERFFCIEILLLDVIGSTEMNRVK